jgi:hypothetical protein
VKYIAALSDGGMVSHLFSEDQTKIAAFAQAYDGPGRCIAQCVSELKDGVSTRSLETVKRLSFLHVDVDVRALEQSKEQVLAVLSELPLSLAINDSGRGYHAIARLREPVENGTPEFDRACRLRTALTRVLCGDPANDHSAALLRVPGTTNFKCEPPAQCRVVEAGAPVSLEDIAAFLDMFAKPLFVFKIKTNGSEQSRKGKRIRRQPLRRAERCGAQKS